MKRFTIVFILFIVYCISLALPQTLIAQYSYTNESLLEVIKKLDKSSSYRFLYREAQIEDLKVSFTANEDNLTEKLKQALTFKPVAAKIDDQRKQIIIYKRKQPSSKRVTISGYVVDAVTGERLPFATIQWNNNREVGGMGSNSAGSFQIEKRFTAPVLTINATYLGYKKQTISLNLEDQEVYSGITFRLQPTMVDGNEIIVTDRNMISGIDNSLSQNIDMATFSPLGETNTIRALQQLPSVNINAALEGGINVRGSSVDGFQVLLDGITIYKQSHLYGLIDSFNADVLQKSGLYYDITPAEFEAPPGGTLALYTRTGSLNKLQGTAGISNATLDLALNGPLQNGKSSWLISARTSYMDAVNWLNNKELIEWGLNVNRDREVLSDGTVNLDNRLVRTNNTDAQFVDLHGKIYFEGREGSRFIVSGYLGLDDTQLDATRLFRSFNTQNSTNFENRPVSTENEWSNAAGSFQYQKSISPQLFSKTMAGVSIYQTDYVKEDFTFNRFDQGNNALQAFTFPFENESVLNEIKFEQSFYYNTKNIIYSAGGQYQYFKSEYREDSFNRPGFFDRTTAHKVDGYLQAELVSVDIIDLFAGTRVHYYSAGDFVKWSPRFKARFFPEGPVSFGGGVSRNFQFLNQISLSNVVTSDIWVLADAQQAPASVDYYTAGVYINKIPNTYIQLEAYLKDYKNLRLHELNTLSLSNTFAAVPWFSQNSGKGKGVEFFLKNRFDAISASLSHSLSIASMEMQNPQLNDGEPFFVDWDRRYQYRTTLNVKPAADFDIQLSWMYATGMPNRLATFGPENEQRLGNYQRADVSLNYQKSTGFGKVKAGVSVYNLFDRNNPWYRELAFVLDQSGAFDRFRSVPSDVYDLGFQPSFSINVLF